MYTTACYTVYRVSFRGGGGGGVAFAPPLPPFGECFNFKIVRIKIIDITAVFG